MTRPVPITARPADDPVDAELAAQDAIARAKWFDSIGEVARWPVDAGTAVKLLRDGGLFAVDGEALDSLVDHVIIGGPDDEGEWSATDVLDAARALEFRRAWQPDSPHDAKRLPAELALEVARQDDRVAEAAAVPGFDLLGTLFAVAYNESREQRLALVALFRLILEAQKGVRV